MKKAVAKIGLLLMVAFMVTLVSCEPEECEQIVPEISYKSFNRTQDSAVLTITFIDCDGDIGLSEDEVDPPYDFNLFVNYLELIDNEWVKLELNEDNDLRYRIPMLESSGNTDRLEGEVEVTMLNSKFGTADTVSYEVYILDRALNESNRVQSPSVLFP